MSIAADMAWALILLVAAVGGVCAADECFPRAWPWMRRKWRDHTCRRAGRLNSRHPIIKDWK